MFSALAPTVWWISLQIRSECWLKPTVCSRSSAFTIKIKCICKGGGFQSVYMSIFKVQFKSLFLGRWWAVFQRCLQQQQTNRGHEKSQSSVGYGNGNLMPLLMHADMCQSTAKFLSTGECLSGALWWKDLLLSAEEVGFSPPRLVTASLITVENKELQEVLGLFLLFFYVCTLNSVCLNN